MSQFEVLENELNALLNAVTRKAQHLASGFGSGPERTKRLADAERDARQARLLLDKLETAARGADGAARQRMALRVRPGER